MFKRKYRVLSDREVKFACDLRGVPFEDGGRVIFQVIPQAFGGRLRRYVLLRSTMGSKFGRWEVEPANRPY